jgi:hypothetical protein
VTAAAGLVLGWLAAFLISIVPALMPPMWAVLAAFVVGLDVPLLPLGIGAGVTAAAGRLVLARISRELTPILSETDQRNAEALGEWFGRRGARKWFFVALYCLGPFPSNVLFIAAGAGRIRALPVAGIYAATRAVSDTFWAWVAVSTARGARDILEGSVAGWRGIALQLVSAAAVVLLFRLPWARWLGIDPRRRG